MIATEIIVRKSSCSCMVVVWPTILIQLMGSLFLQSTFVHSFLPPNQNQTNSNNHTTPSARMNDMNETHLRLLNEITVSSHSKCKSAGVELDECSAQLIAFGRASAQLPHSIEELDSVYCPNFRRAVECVKRSAECYKPFERQIIKWVLVMTFIDHSYRYSLHQFANCLFLINA